MGAKMAPASTKWRQNDDKFLVLLAAFFEPNFHETIVILMPLGHRGFEKVIFSMDTG